MPTSDEIVVGLGEVLWDCCGDSRRPGGAPANVAFHARQLGCEGVICARVGDDELGRELLDALAQRGLGTSFLQRDPVHPTGRVTVDSTDPERPSYTIHEQVAWDHLQFDDDIERLMHGAAAVCFGTLAQRSPRSRETIHHALQAAGNALVVYDVNLRQPWYQREWIERSLRAAHVVKVNREELAVLTDLLETGAGDAESLARGLRERFGVELTCVTRAERGCLLIGAQQQADVPGTRVDVVDAVGAGDALTAALIFGLLRRWPLEKVAGLANAVGALVAGRPGAMPRLPEEFADLVAKTHVSGGP